MSVSLGVRGIFVSRSGTGVSIYHYAKSYENEKPIRLTKGIYMTDVQFEEMKKKMKFLKSHAAGKEIEKFTISGDVHIYGATFEGQKLLHIRKFFNDRPTKFGIALRNDEVNDLMCMMKDDVTIAK